MNNILNSVEVGIELSQLATTMHDKTRAVVEKVAPYAERYANTDNPDDRATICLEMLNSDEEIYTLAHLDTSIIPTIIKTVGNLTLREAAIILLCAVNPLPDDVAKMIATYVADDAVQTTTEETSTIDNILIIGRDAMNVRRQFDIRDFLNLGEHLRHHCENGDWDKVEIILAHLKRFQMLTEATGV